MNSPSFSYTSPCPQTWSDFLLKWRFGSPAVFNRGIDIRYSFPNLVHEGRWPVSRVLTISWCSRYSLQAITCLIVSSDLRLGVVHFKNNGRIRMWVIPVREANVGIIQAFFNRHVSW